MRTTSLWKARNDVLSSALGDDIALLDPATNTYFTLNETASVIWNALSNPTSLDNICAAVAAEYDIQAAECADDVLAVITDLADKALIENVTEPESAP